MFEYVKKFFKNFKDLFSKKGFAFMLFGPLLVGFLLFLILFPLISITNLTKFFISILYYNELNNLTYNVLDFIIGLIVILIEIFIISFFGIYIIRLARSYLTDRFSLSSIKVAFTRALDRVLTGSISNITIFLINGLIFTFIYFFGFILLFISEKFGRGWIVSKIIIVFILIISVLLKIFLSVVFWSVNYIVEGTEIKRIISIIKNAFAIGIKTFWKALQTIISFILVIAIPVFFLLLILGVISVTSFISLILAWKSNIFSLASFNDVYLLVVVLFALLQGVGLILILGIILTIFILILWSISSLIITLLQLFEEVKQSFLS